MRKGKGLNFIYIGKEVILHYYILVVYLIKENPKQTAPKKTVRKDVVVLKKKHMMKYLKSFLHRKNDQNGGEGCELSRHTALSSGEQTHQKEANAFFENYKL